MVGECEEHFDLPEMLFPTILRLSVLETIGLFGSETLRGIYLLLYFEILFLEANHIKSKMLNFASFKYFSIRPMKSKTMVFMYENATNELLTKTEINYPHEITHKILQIAHTLTPLIWAFCVR